MRQCLDHRPRVEDDDGHTITITCPNCNVRLITTVPKPAKKETP